MKNVLLDSGPALGFREVSLINLQASYNFYQEIAMFGSVHKIVAVIYP
jgi:hypothetical protein